MHHFRDGEAPSRGLHEVTQWRVREIHEPGVQKHENPNSFNVDQK
jgi:hypothetical protein